MRAAHRNVAPLHFYHVEQQAEKRERNITLIAPATTLYSDIRKCSLLITAVFPSVVDITVAYYHRDDLTPEVRYFH